VLRKEGEEKYEENKTNFEGAYRNSLADLARIWNCMEVPHLKGIHTENFVSFCSRSVELQMRENGVFFTPVKYTCLLHAPSFLGHTTHLCGLIVLKHPGIVKILTGCLPLGNLDNQHDELA